MSARKSRKAILAALRSRAAGEPPPYKLIVKKGASQQTVVSAGSGAPLVVTVDEHAAPFIRALTKLTIDDDEAAEFSLREEEPARYWEAAILALIAFIVAHRGVARICTGSKADDLAVRIFLRQIVPAEWLAVSDETSGKYRLGPSGSLEVDSVKRRRMWLLCDIVLVTDYTATSRRAVERALAAAPRRILCGPAPKKPSHRWIRAYEARAQAAGRHYS